MSAGPELLLVGFAETEAAGPLRALAAQGVAATHAGAAAVPPRPEGEGAGPLLCLGPGLAPAEALALLRRTAAAEPPGLRRHLVLAAGDDLSPFQSLVDEDRLFFLTRRPPAEPELAALLAAAVAHARAAEGGGDRPAPDGLALAARESVLELHRQWAQAAGPAAAAALVARAARTLAGAPARCLLHDPDTDTLAAAGGDAAAAESCAAGLVGWAVRTGRPVRVERAGDDPRWDAAADTPGGSPHDRLLVQPLAAGGGADGAEHVWAVLVLSRGAGDPPFSDAEAAAVAFLARHAAALAARFTLRRELSAQEASDDQRLFRRRAVDHHAGGAGGRRARPLEISPAWVGRTAGLLAAAVATALLFLSAARIDEYAGGPAVVRAGAGTDVTARLAGTVAAVAAAPGEEVAAGQLLLRLDGGDEAAELERVERELELALAQRLRDPRDAGVEARLQALRASRDLAAARLEARAVRAPHAGVVGDLRVRPGQRVAPGEVLATLAGGGGGMSVVALLPAHYRPQLRPGMTLRLELDGYRWAYQELVVERVAAEAVGPEEARRVLGAEIGDALPVAAPVVFVSARLPAGGTFRGDGRDYRYHPGLRGTAEVRVRSERVLLVLLPGLEALLGSDGSGDG